MSWKISGGPFLLLICFCQFSTESTPKCVVPSTSTGSPQTANLRGAGKQRKLVRHKSGHPDVALFNVRMGSERHVEGLSGIEGHHPFALIICSACLREVSVNFAPDSMRATSSVRSSPSMRRTEVFVRPALSRFSIT